MFISSGYLEYLVEISMLEGDEMHGIGSGTKLLI